MLSVIISRSTAAFGGAPFRLSKCTALGSAGAGAGAGAAVGGEPEIKAIETLEGTMWAQPGDWIIKGVQGEFYPCKPDIFEATYEIVKEDD